MDPAADSDTNPRAVNWVEDDIIPDPDWNPKSFSCCDEDITPWADTLVKNDDISIVYVVKNEDKLYKTTQLIDELYSDINYVTIPAWDCLPYDNLSPGTRVTGERINSFLK